MAAAQDVIFWQLPKKHDLRGKSNYFQPIFLQCLQLQTKVLLDKIVSYPLEYAFSCVNMMSVIPALGPCRRTC